MKKISNEEPEPQFLREREPEKRISSLENLSTFKQIFATGGMALIAVLLLSDNEKVNDKTTVNVAMYDDRHASSTTVDKLSMDKSGEFVDSDTRALLDGQFMTYMAKLIPIDMSEEENQSDFLSVPHFTDEIKEEVMADYKMGTRRIAVIYVWDNFDQDGDIIQIVSGGLAMDIPLLHAPTRVFLPFKPGESLIIQGLHDGGGGITAAIETSSGPVPLPVLAVGQTIALPIY